MNTDVIMATYGACDVVRESIAAILKHLHINPIVFDNPASTVDGTRDWLAKEAERGNIRLILGERNVKHGFALDALSAECTAEWVLAVDSDLVLRDNVLGVLCTAIRDDVNLIGESIETHGSQRLRAMMMARVHAKLCLYRRQWFQDNQLSWRPRHHALRFVFPDIADQLKKAGIHRAYFDTGWQLYALATASESFVEAALHRHYRHYHGVSSRWRRKNWAIIKPMGLG